MAVPVAVAGAGLGHLVVQAAVAAAVATAMEFAVTALTLWMRHRTSPVELWRLARMHALVTVVLCAPVAGLFASSYRTSGIWVLGFFAIPVAASHFAFGMHAPKEQLIGALEQANAELEAANSHLRRINMSFAEALVKAIDGRDAYTAGHSKAVAEYSRDIASELGLPREEVQRIHLCGLVHDIGKIGVRDAVLLKPGALDEPSGRDAEPPDGRLPDPASQVPSMPKPMVPCVRNHHERWDGTGYPDNLKAEDIPCRPHRLPGRRLRRHGHRPPLQACHGPERAIEQLVLGKGSQYETGPVDAFLRVLARAPGLVPARLLRHGRRRACPDRAGGVPGRARAAGGRVACRSSSRRPHRPIGVRQMRELRLIEILSDAAAALAAPDADPESVERVLADAVARASVPCTLRPTSTGVEIDCSRSPGRLELAFVSVLSDCAKLAVAASGASIGRTLDAHAFALELERAASIARWRGQPLAVAVFEVSGLEMGPGMIDQADTVAEVGELALSAVRQDDRVGHIGAAQFALLFPRAGTFEARSAFKRVRTALAASDRMSRDLAIGAVGFVELAEGDSGAEVLAAAREREDQDRMRRAYLSPVDPTDPLAD